MRAPEPFLPVHGGDGARIAAMHGVDVANTIDFSVNVNPLGPPASVIDFLCDAAEMLASIPAYPDREAYVFKDAISKRYGIPQASIVVGNGSAALLDAALRATPPCTCLVPVPAFSEYRHAIEAAGHRLLALRLRSEDDFNLDVQRTIAQIDAARPGAVILTNPHNPSGALCAREDVLAIAEFAAGTGCAVILDEAFIDYAPEESLLADALRLEHLLVLRSVTKFYAMPGLRVGYAVASPSTAQRIAAFLPSWPVTTIALQAAARALGDDLYDKRSLAHNAALREDLSRKLQGLGIRVVPSFANFLLLEMPASWGSGAQICERLVRDAGIVVRDCADYDGLSGGTFIRVAVKDATDNQRLLEAFGALSRRRST